MTQRTSPFPPIATVPIPVRTDLCHECGHLTTGRCPSCLRPTCDWCTRGNACSDPVCPWCHEQRCGRRCEQDRHDAYAEQMAQIPDDFDPYHDYELEDAQ